MVGCQIVKRAISLSEYPDRNSEPVQLTPRSVQACGLEGIDPSELVYRRIDDFSEKGLSPRLVKLRYDFYEAKRKDLLAAAKKTWESLQETCGSLGQCKFYSEPSNAGILDFEKSKLDRVQQEEKRWLENVLKNELRVFQQLESDLTKLSSDEKAAGNKTREEAERLRELNERRRAEEDKKQREIEARLKSEKIAASMEFARQQEELRAEQEKEVAKKQELHERSLAEAERRKKQEDDKKEKGRQAFLEQQSRSMLMVVKDQERLEILDSQKAFREDRMKQRQQQRADRFTASQKNTLQMEIFKREEFLMKMKSDEDRDYRLNQLKERQQEKGAKKSLQLLIRRKHIADESQRKMEERRMSIMQQQNDTDKRLYDHEKKKTKFLEFKKELDNLRDKNKQMNVTRQRRKEGNKRDMISQLVEMKDRKVDDILDERKKLWDVRRKISVQSQTGRDEVKRAILQMRVKSSVNSADLKTLIHDVLNKRLPQRKTHNKNLSRKINHKSPFQASPLVIHPTTSNVTEVPPNIDEKSK